MDCEGPAGGQGLPQKRPGDRSGGEEDNKLMQLERVRRRRASRRGTDNGFDAPHKQPASGGMPLDAIDGDEYNPGDEQPDKVLQAELQPPQEPQPTRQLQAPNQWTHPSEPQITLQHEEQQQHPPPQPHHSLRQLQKLQLREGSQERLTEQRTAEQQRTRHLYNIPPFSAYGAGASRSSGAFGPTHGAPGRRGLPDLDMRILQQPGLGQQHPHGPPGKLHQLQLMLTSRSSFAPTAASDDLSRDNCDDNSSSTSISSDEDRDQEGRSNISNDTMDVALPRMEGERGLPRGHRPPLPLDEPPHVPVGRNVIAGEGEGGHMALPGMQGAVPADPVSAVMENGDLLKLVLMELQLADLCRVASVSHLWMRVVHDPSFWRRVSLLGRSVCPKQVVQLCRRHRCDIEELRISMNNSNAMRNIAGELPSRLNTLELQSFCLSHLSLARVCSEVSTLRHLILSGVQIDISGLESAAAISHPGLTSLELIRVKADGISISCPQLLNLSIRECTISLLTATGTLLPRLEHLYLGEVQRLSERNILHAVTSLTTLRQLSLEGVPAPEELLRGVAQAMEHLTQMEIVGCSWLNLALRRGAPLFMSLRRLVIRRCDMVSATASSLLDGCSGVEELVLEGCGGLVQLHAVLPMVRSISLRGCRSLSLLDLKCRRLQELDIGTAEPDRFSGSLLRRVSLASDALRSISWSHLQCLEEVTLDCPALTSLSLTDCNSLTDKIFDVITDVQELTLAPEPAEEVEYRRECVFDDTTTNELMDDQDDDPLYMLLKRDFSDPGQFLGHELLQPRTQPMQRQPQPQRQPQLGRGDRDEGAATAEQGPGEGDGAGGSSGAGGSGGAVWYAASSSTTSLASSAAQRPSAPSATGNWLRGVSHEGGYAIRSGQQSAPPLAPWSQQRHCPVQPRTAGPSTSRDGGSWGPTETTNQQLIEKLSSVGIEPEVQQLHPLQQAYQELGQQQQPGQQLLELPPPEPLQPLLKPPRARQVVAYSKTGGCPRLQELRLERCDGLRHTRLRHSCLVTASLHSCRGLQTLRLGCPALVNLVLEDCRELESVALSPAAMRSLSLGVCSALREAKLACPSLEQLSLKGCGSLRRVALDCPRLRDLDATFCNGLTDEGLTTALASRPPLNSLMLSVCCSLGPAMTLLVSSLGELRHLDLSYSCVSQLTPVLFGCTGLTALCLGSCPDLIAGGEELLQLLPGRGHALPNLVYLDVSYCPLGPHVVVPLVRGLTQLTFLALNGCIGVEESIWRCVAPHASGSRRWGMDTDRRALPALESSDAPAAQLEKLSLVRCTALVSLCLGLMSEEPDVDHQSDARSPDSDDTDGVRGGSSGMGAAAAGIGYLGLGPHKTLRSAGQIGGPGSGWRWPEGSPQPLTRLGPPWRPVDCLMSGLCSLRLGLSGVQVVALSLPHLTYLDFNGCSSLRYLELHCPALSELHLQGCSALPADAWLPLLEALSGNNNGSLDHQGRGLTLLDAQHSRAFGEAVAATVAAAGVMAAAAAAAAAEDGTDTDPGPGCSSAGGGLVGDRSKLMVPAVVVGEGEVAPAVCAGEKDEGKSCDDESDDTDDCILGSSAVGEGAGGMTGDAGALLVAQNQPWWLLPRGATVLVCGSGCTTCAYRNRRTLGLSV